MEHDRITDVIHHVTGDLFHLAPIPFIYHEVEKEGISFWHKQLIEEARRVFPEPVLEVPDVRHINDLGSPPSFNAKMWSEYQNTPVGVWHNVPTNGYLGLDASPVRALRQLVEERYLYALKMLGVGCGHKPWITESWIQFYKPGDYKVLHNHERYGPPYPSHPWAGAYYIDDGAPDPTIPYSGILSFRVRNTNYYIRPHAGLLVMWPSDILHEVHPFYGACERVVVNFNINTEYP